MDWSDGRSPYRAPLLFALMLVVTAHGIWVARSLDTFKLADQLRRVAAVADYINADVPPSAVILAGEQSGSMRYYTDRPILRWEAATPEALAAAIDDARAVEAPGLHRARRVGGRAVPREVRVAARRRARLAADARSRHHRIARGCGNSSDRERFHARREAEHHSPAVRYVAARAKV